VGVLYVAALIVGAGTLSLQLLLAGDSDGHGDGDVGQHDGSVHAGHGEAGFLPILLSLRFWTYGLLAFGMVGTLLHYLELAGSTLTLISAIGIGLLSGFVASYSLRLLAQSDTSSGAEASDAVGQLGRVLVSCRKGERGKVRIELRGQSVDFIATTDEAELEGGTSVLVEEVRGGTLHVSRAPDDLLPPKSSA
jgi:membrane protein implicated in regulation of membrane protease activity